MQLTTERSVKASQGYRLTYDSDTAQITQCNNLTHYRISITLCNEQARQRVIAFRMGYCVGRVVPDLSNGAFETSGTSQ